MCKLGSTDNSADPFLLWRDEAGYCGIWRDMAEYGGIFCGMRRKVAGCHVGGGDLYDKTIVKFKHPTRDYDVYATLDACHMLKNACNCLGDLGAIRNGKGEIIM